MISLFISSVDAVFSSFESDDEDGVALFTASMDDACFDSLSDPAASSFDSTDCSFTVSLSLFVEEVVISFSLFSIVFFC